VVDALFSKDESQLARLRGSSSRGALMVDVQTGLHALVPRSDAQRVLLSRALALADQAAATRAAGSLDLILPTPLLVVVPADPIFVGFSCFLTQCTGVRSRRAWLRCDFLILK
jgi:hypothetical protein